MSILGAATGGKKTWLALQFAKAAQDQGSVMIYSPEMRRVDLYARMFQVTAKMGLRVLDEDPFEVEKILDDPMLRAQYEADWTVVGVLSREDRAEVGSLSLEIDAWAETMGAPGLVVVDYAQYVLDDLADSREPRYAQAAKVVNGMQAIADHYQCAVLLTSQIKEDKEQGFRLYESGKWQMKAANVVYLSVEDEKPTFNFGKVRDGVGGTPLRLSWEGPGVAERGSSLALSQPVAKSWRKE